MPSKLKKPKFIFIVGGVLSGVGKGVTSASLGALFKARGLEVTALKADPYVNVDAGTMNPIEHGEVFVTDDGDETDQDMGNYERFLETDLLSDNYMTTGRVYMSVIENERSMKYKGKCVQVVPHIPLEIVRRIKNAQKKSHADVTIVEIGGSVGEYENILFLEAARMMKLEAPDSVAFVLVSYLPIPKHIGEMKTKPTQHAARQLNSAGINPDFIVARGEFELDKPRREKLAVFCGVSQDHCISAPDVDSIYEIPLKMEEQGFTNKLMKVLGIEQKRIDLSNWKKLNHAIANPKKDVRIAVVGKYFGTGDYTLSDSYISVIEAVKHAAWSLGAQPQLEWIDSEVYEKKPAKVKDLAQFDAIIVPGGFGARGIEGVIKAIKFAREHKIPYFGLCYGMQLACIEFARDILGIKAANTVEINPDTKEPIIHISPYQAKNVLQGKYGGTMRLGAFSCDLKKGSKVRKAYGKSSVSERHRHRYEFNNAYRDRLDKAGLEIVGVNPESNLVEIVELRDHPFFVGVQFHPEFKSRPMQPHPLFEAFIRAAIK
ncbi:CTP synthase [Candidatus Nomurabacteria bacterium]|nr:CTP synthase [Candidatus Nomurabacteria bacterium]